MQVVPEQQPDQRAALDGDTALTRLEREGRFTPPASEATPWPAQPAGPAYSDSEIDLLLDDMRGDH